MPFVPSRYVPPGIMDPYGPTGLAALLAAQAAAAGAAAVAEAVARALSGAGGSGEPSTPTDETPPSSGETSTSSPGTGWTTPTTPTSGGTVVPSAPGRGRTLSAAGIPGTGSGAGWGGATGIGGPMSTASGEPAPSEDLGAPLGTGMLSTGEPETSPLLRTTAGYIPSVQDVLTAPTTSSDWRPSGSIPSSPLAKSPLGRLIIRTYAPNSTPSVLLSVGNPGHVNALLLPLQEDDLDRAIRDAQDKLKKALLDAPGSKVVDWALDTIKDEAKERLLTAAEKKLVERIEKAFEWLKKLAKVEEAWEKTKAFREFTESGAAELALALVNLLLDALKAKRGTEYLINMGSITELLDEAKKKGFITDDFKNILLNVLGRLPSFSEKLSDMMKSADKALKAKAEADYQRRRQEALDRNEIPPDPPQKPPELKSILLDIKRGLAEVKEKHSKK